MIDTLQLLTPEPHRTRRTKALCHERLARQRKRAKATGRLTEIDSAIERALVCGFGLIYISGIAVVVVQVLGGF